MARFEKTTLRGGKQVEPGLDDDMLIVAGNFARLGGHLEDYKLSFKMFYLTRRETFSESCDIEVEGEIKEEKEEDSL